MTSPAGAPAGGVDCPAAGDPPSQLTPDAAPAGAGPTRRRPHGRRRASRGAAAETPAHDVADRREPLDARLGEIQPLGTSGEADTQVMPEPIDEAAEEQAAAAEAAAIGGSAGNEYAGSELGEPATEAERPLAEAGEGVAEGQEQAEAELEENAGPGDEGMSDAERQIDDTIEAADNPAIGETPEAAHPARRSRRRTGRRRRHLRRRLEDVVGRRRKAAMSGRRLRRSPKNRQIPHAGLKGSPRAVRCSECRSDPTGVPLHLHARDRRRSSTACPASSDSSSSWQEPAPR